MKAVEKLKYFTIVMCMCAISGMTFIGCNSDDDDEPSNKEFDSSVLGEWVETNGKYSTLADYYYFYSDGTVTHGSYEWKIDWVNEDDEYKWFTIDRKYLYIDGIKYEYSCNGSTLELTRNGKTRTYREK